jgi:cation transport protein ChaC
MAISNDLEEDPDMAITRAALDDGSFLAAVRAIDGIKVKTDAELAASLWNILSSRPSSADIWVFGYASLIWNPAFRFVERRSARLSGWHRRFALRAPFGRGSFERPGLMLALDQEGSTEGVAFRLAVGNERDELGLIWRREMFTDAYKARWVTLETDPGTIAAIAFTANSEGSLYVPAMDDRTAAAQIATARGSLGSCADYLFDTITHLAQFGLRDEGLDTVKQMVIEHQRASAAGQTARST